MRSAKRLSFLVPLGAWLLVQSCFTDNDPAYSGILGITRPPPKEPMETSSSGGSGQGGATSVSTTTSSAAGLGGQGGGGEGGEGATGGSGGGTLPSDNPPVDPNFSPACFLTQSQSGEEIKKGTPCTADDPQLCYRPCGPNQIGWKTETCLASVYAEGDCTFPDDKEYSCYSIPDEIDVSACGLTAPPSATGECEAPLCMACNFDGQYQDTGDNVKDGYCVCREADADGVRRWTCASTTAWPCPFSRGC